MNQQNLPAHGIVITPLTVQPEWLDYNGHMNVAWYVAAFDLGIEDLKTAYGLDADYRQRHARSTVALESHITYQNEAGLGDALRVESRILATDGKRLHLYQEIHRGTDLLSTQETLSISFDLAARRSCPFDPILRERIEALQQAQTGVAVPAWVGRRVTLQGRRPAG